MAAVEDLLGWRDTRWGMSDSEIEAVLDRAKLKRLPNRLTINGLNAEDCIPYYDLLYGPLVIGNTNFNVKFIMRPYPSQDRLATVVIQSERWSAISKGEAVIIRQIISEKLGKFRRNGSSEEFWWAFKTTTVTYFYILGRDDGVACIQFMPTANAPVEQESAL